MLMVHYALVYLETCVDEAPFGFVSKESEQFKSIEIPKEICVSYKEYLHRCLSKKNCLSGFYADVAAKVRDTARKGDDIVVLCEGDPFFYGSFMHLYTRLKDDVKKHALLKLTSALLEAN